MTTRLICRVLDPSIKLLGWAEALGQIRGDGKIWVERPTPVQIIKAGTPTFLSVHWCDMNVEVRLPIDHKAVVDGDWMLLPGDWTAITCGSMPTDLPAVTVSNPVAVGIPVGQLGSGASGALSLT